MQEHCRDYPLDSNNMICAYLANNSRNRDEGQNGGGDMRGEVKGGYQWRWEQGGGRSVDTQHDGDVQCVKNKHHVHHIV